jgi:hypothetical protein
MEITVQDVLTYRQTVVRIGRWNVFSLPFRVQSMPFKQFRICPFPLV